MKNLLYILLLLATFFVGCNTEEQLFDGKDNSLTSFSVTANGTTYHAAIRGSQIIVCAPAGTDLSNAQVEYELCERASMVPDPKSINDWNSQHVFRVKSYLAAPREYTYSVHRTDIAQQGNIQLLTQSDVEAFAKLGTTVIEGNLIIGSDTKPVQDSIVNIDALASLKEVRYNIIVNRSFTGGTLKGLENIEMCGGIRIGTTTTPIELPAQSGLSINLPVLKSTGDITLNSNSIKSISFENLEAAASLFISSNSLVALKLPQLAQTVEGFSLENSSGSTNSILHEVSLPKLTKVGGRLSMQYFSGVTAVTLPALTNVGGDLNIALNSAMLEELTLPELTSIHGAVIIERAPSILKLSIPKIKHITSFAYNKSSYGSYPLESLDLASLETIGNEIYIRGVSIEVLNLPKLTSVGGDAIFWDLKSATALDMPSIKKIGKRLQLYSLTMLDSLDISTLDSLAQLELIGCLALEVVKSPATASDITINYASNGKCPTPQFEGLKRVTGMLSFMSDYQTTLFDISNIEHIGTLKFSGGATGNVLNLFDVESIDTFDLSSSNITTLNAPKLKEISTMKFSYITSLTTLTIPQLKRVESFSLTEHNQWGVSSARMTNLDAYSGITSIGSVKISYCNKLVDFSGLSGVIPTLTADTWSVSNCGYNPTFDDMVEGRHTNP